MDRVQKQSRLLAEIGVGFRSARLEITYRRFKAREVPDILPNHPAVAQHRPTHPGPGLPSCEHDSHTPEDPMLTRTSRLPQPDAPLTLPQARSIDRGENP